MPDKSTLKLSTEKLPAICSAMAMFSEAGLASFIMRLLFQLKIAPIPTKNFYSEKDPVKWLKHYL